MAQVSVFDAGSILAAVPASDAIERTRLAFERHAAGEWVMPPKVYVDAPPDGDFRAMPARGEGLAILKWVTSFPRNPERGLPVVTGALVVSSAETGELVAIMDTAAITSLRTGAAAAVSARALAREDAASVGAIGCGVNGAWAARCLAAIGFERGVCSDVRPNAAQVLGADAAGKSEVEPAALERCRLFCDEWEQASKGGELARAVATGALERERVTELGDVLLGRAEGRRSAEEVTLFDSTGLAIQDLAIALAVLDAHRAGRV